MRKDGSMLDVALTISPMKDAAGAIVGSIETGTGHNPKRKRAEAALRQAQADLAYMSRVTTMGEFDSIASSRNQTADFRSSNNARTWLAMAWSRGPRRGRGK